MKILVEKAQGANHYIAKSYATAFHLIGHSVVFWDDTEKSVHDVFQEFEPDILFAHTWRLNRARINCINARPDMKIVMRANHYGSLDKDIDTKIYPIGIADDNERRNVEAISKHPGFKNIICQYIDRFAKGTHDLWENYGQKVTGIPLCADITDYFYTEPNDKYKTHLTFVGGFWPYKSKYLSSYILPLLYPNTMLSVKVFGTGGWGTPSYVGQANEATIRNHYSSAVACPNIYEPHSVIDELPFISDLNQRLYQIPASFGVEISQNATGLSDMYTEDEIIIVNSPKEFLERFIHLSENEEERLVYKKNGLLRTYREHTNLHRASTLLKLLDLQEESKKCLELANKNYEDVNARINQIIK